MIPVDTSRNRKCLHSKKKKLKEMYFYFNVNKMFNVNLNFLYGEFLKKMFNSKPSFPDHFPWPNPSKNLWTHPPPLSMGFSKQEHWSGLPCSPPRESPRPRDWTQVSCIAGGLFPVWATSEAHSKVKDKRTANGTSPAVQWLWLLPTQAARVLSLVWELRPNMPQGTAKRKVLK